MMIRWIHIPHTVPKKDKDKNTNRKRGVSYSRKKFYVRFILKCCFKAQIYVIPFPKRQQAYKENT